MKRVGLWLVGIVLLVAVGIAASGYVQKSLRDSERMERLQKAEAMFAERCKTAGEKIYRTVEDVEVIYLLKLRPNKINYGNQFQMDDPYGSDSGGESYIKSFLKGFHKPSPNRIEGDPLRIGYRYVEAVDPADGRRYRYTGRIEEPWQYDKSYLKGYTRFVLDKELAEGNPPRYGVTYDDISTRGEREFWIAGSSLKVIDLQTNEVIAERIGYMMDRAQGNDSGGRSPWLLAASNACPGFQRYKKPTVPTPSFSQQINQTADFVEKVLRPQQGE